MLVPGAGQGGPWGAGPDPPKDGGRRTASNVAGVKIGHGMSGTFVRGSFINIAKLCIIIKGWPSEKIQVVVLVYLYLSTTIIFILGKGAEKSIFSVRVYYTVESF